ncbi:MAG: flavoprotein [Planctomycetota bacterium]
MSELVHLGVGAGAATFKAVALASLLAREGFEVRVVMSQDARAFVAPLSFVAVTGNAVVESSLSVDPDGTGSHLKSAAASAFVLVPATANLIARVAHGFGSDAVSLAALSAPEPRFFCPAMNDRMWQNPLVQENVVRLEKVGWKRIGPEFGRLAEGYEGQGRMSEPEAILAVLLESLR